MRERIHIYCIVKQGICIFWGVIVVQWNMCGLTIWSRRHSRSSGRNDFVDISSNRLKSLFLWLWQSFFREFGCVSRRDTQVTKFAVGGRWQRYCHDEDWLVSELCGGVVWVDFYLCNHGMLSYKAACLSFNYWSVCWSNVFISHCLLDWIEKIQQLACVQLFKCVLSITFL